MPSKISLMTAVLQADLDDTAALEVTNKLGQTRKSTIAQLRTAIVAGVLVAAHLTSPVIDSGGLTITSGTLGAQAVTATALTVTPGATSLAATSVTTLAGTGAATGFTSYGGVVMSAGAVSGVTTLAGSGALSGFTTAGFSGNVTITKASGNNIQLILAQTGVQTWNLSNLATSGTFQIDDGVTSALSIAKTSLVATFGGDIQGHATTFLGGNNGDYGYVGNNMVPSGAANSFTYRVNDFASAVHFDSGRILFKTAASGLAGNAVPFSVVATITQTGDFSNVGNLTTGSVAGGSALLAGRLFSFNGTLNNWLFEVRNSNANPFGIITNYSTSAPNGTSNQFWQCIDNAATRAEMRSNGGLANFSANNVNLSDARLKTDIRTLESVWDKHLGIRVVRAKYADQTHGDDNYMGIAQNIGEVFPELMDDADPNRLGIYENDLNWITRGVVQECQRRIVALEAFRSQAVKKYPSLAAA